jgi:Ca-activated chloride channel family protein
MVIAAKVTAALRTPIRIGLLSLVLVISGCGGDWNDLWLTRDQQAQQLADSGDHAAAAQLFSDPMRSGTEWYRAGEFERAAAAFGTLGSAGAYFNRGNALVFLGKYEDAIRAYDNALQVQPEWREAEENLLLAQARMARLERPEDDAGGTGGMLEADEIVFDLDASSKPGQGEQTVEEETGLRDDQLRELWLRRVETQPADFLAARFAYQLVLQSEPADE